MMKTIHWGDSKTMMRLLMLEILVTVRERNEKSWVALYLCLTCVMQEQDSASSDIRRL